MEHIFLFNTFFTEEFMFLHVNSCQQFMTHFHLNIKLSDILWQSAAYRDTDRCMIRMNMWII